MYKITLHVMRVLFAYPSKGQPVELHARYAIHYNQINHLPYMVEDYIFPAVNTTLISIIIYQINVNKKRLADISLQPL